MIGPLIFILTLIGLMVIQVPIGFAIAITSIICFGYYGVAVETLAQSLYSGLNSYTWIAIPMFILAGNLMSKGGLSKRLVAFSESIVGGVRGGLGITTIFASAFFAAISGSSPATTAAIGGIMVPEMKKKNYPEKFAAAISASGGVLGVLIPPSVLFVVYGVLTQVSVSKLFLAGILPGILVALAMVIVTYFMARKYVPQEDGSQLRKFALKEVLRTFKSGFLSLLAPLIILGGIYGGIFTPTESAIVAVFYGIIIGLLYKELTLNGIWESLKATIYTTGTLAIIWAAASSYSYVLTLSGIAQLAVTSLQSVSTNPIVIVMLLSIVVVVLGCFINAMGMVVLLTPIFLPILNAVGFDPLVFGVLFVMLCEIGYITPPVGTNLFIAKTLVEKPDVLEIAWLTVPYMLVLYVLVFVFLLFPGIITALPGLM